MKRTIINCDKCREEIKLGKQHELHYSLIDYHYCDKCIVEIKKFCRLQ